MKKTLAVLFIVALCAQAANAADSVLGVNFSSGWAGPHVGMGAHPTQTADGFSNWTDSNPITSSGGSSSGTGLVVLGSDGGVTVDWASSNYWYAGLEDNAENALYRAYLDDGGAGALITIRGLSKWLTSIGAKGYTVRIYQNTDWNNAGFLATNLTDGTNVLESVTPTNMWAAANGGTRAFVDSGILRAGTLVIDGANQASGKRGGIAGFKITAIPNVQAVAPANGAINVAIDQDLTWVVNDPNATHIDLYFAANDPNVAFVPGSKKLSMEPVTTTTWDTGTLDYYTTYYWRVDSLEPNTFPGGSGYIKTEGQVNSFTTVPQTAAINPVSPARSVHGLGTDVELSVTGFSIETYQWYKYDSQDEFALSEGTKYEGVTTATLTIKNFQLADEGYYYCIGSNSLPSSASNRNTGPGYVMIQRLTSHYPMEVIDANSTPDIVGGFNMSLKNDVLTGSLPVLGTDVAVAGLGTYSLVLGNPNTDPNGQRFGQLPTDVAKYEDITISTWVKWNGGNEWQRIIDFGSNQENTMFLTPKAGGSGLRFAFEINNGGEQLLNAPALTVGKWTHVAVTITGNTGRMYVNGELVNTNTNLTNNPINLPQTANYLGKSQYPDAKFNGLIDELKIYNYARSAVQIAQDYADIVNTSVCNREGTDDMQFDTNDDCMIDLKDFAELAKDWLNDNRIYPQ